MTRSRLVVEHMTPEQESLFREMTGIISNPRLSLTEMYDLLEDNPLILQIHAEKDA